jgi:Ribonuclease G/E
MNLEDEDWDGMEEGPSEEEIKKEHEALMRAWKEIKEKGE